MLTGSLCLMTRARPLRRSVRSVRDCQLSRLSTCPVDIMQCLLAAGRSGLSTRAVSGSTVLHLFAGRMSARWRVTQSRARRWRFDSTLLVPAAGNWPIAGEALQQMHASDPEDLVVKLRYAVDDCCARLTGHLRPHGILVIGGYRRGYSDARGRDQVIAVYDTARRAAFVQFIEGFQKG
ncbi:hypothetical protein POSPLADRAFT_1067870 [Postia placenta MAD-698-R-SB12]|uniref:Uncharacterized protein n=1 Tax=Postia placenta MAD-698-R-SB12 TaxID=670580 RepID=A0A1X6MN55_9APHY|nr:hypothetical protein POSPLADRAFT_1067870 [Postia placenta MAD-698-R-SB12]OSX57523.1 hypothetical protein POSPLADRAFT_1067870 [Postia placenta MAD-698-R-SB12]